MTVTGESCGNGRPSGTLHAVTADPVTVVGIGADGWAGLSAAARAAVTEAQVLLGSPRQLDLVAGHATGEPVRWPSPLLPALADLLAAQHGRRVCVLASGDPMFFGIGTTLVRLLGADRVRVLPQVSSVTLACARLGWPVDGVDVRSAVGRPLAALHPVVQPGQRLLVLVSEPDAATAVAALLRDRGFGPSGLTLLQRLGGPDERRIDGTADTWSAGPHDPLAIVAVACRPGPDADLLPTVPGLPDTAYDTDGQLTKREVRAVTLAALRPLPGQLLWDVGAGTGTVGIEWMRTHPRCRAVAVEPRADRRDRIAANATALGVPGLTVVAGSAPDALAGLPTPDAVFVGGGVSAPGVIETCLAALPPGGRLVANAVTLAAETTLAGWYERAGGDLVRLSVARAAPVGGYTGWRPAMPVTQWTHTRTEARP